MATRSGLAPLIVIVGETGSGKSNIGVELALTVGGEIICGDSRTVYKKMNIGTAKPSLAQRQAVRHHMLDLVYPSQTYSAARFQFGAKKAIDEIWQRGNWPIMVGGSGLYVDSILFDYSFRSVTDTTKRDELTSCSIEELNSIAKERGLQVHDGKNKRYLIRLLETGEQPADNRSEVRPNTLCVGVRLERSALRSNIEARVEAMFREGLRREVTELLKTYEWGEPGMNGIGYRQFKSYYEGKISMTKVKQDIFRDTLLLAKRQRTWFKRNPGTIWCDNYNDVYDRAHEFILNFNIHNKYNG